MEQTTSEKNVNLEDEFQGLFGGSVSGTGEEELLNIASEYARQISSPQMRALIFLRDRATALEVGGNKPTAVRLRAFVENWMEMKQYNRSDVFVMKALEYISLRKFFNENSFKVDIQK